MHAGLRELLKLGEPFHSLYLAPEGRDAFDRCGLTGGWNRYFAARASPLGAASVELVQATFYGFHRRLIEKAIPDVWRIIDPTDVVQARIEAVDRAAHASMHTLSSAELATAAVVLRAAAERCSPAGRPLFAAHAALPWPSEDHLVLWWAITLLREHRGDGHIALLLSAEVGPCESLVWHSATGELPADYLRSIRGWNEDEWGQAEEGLRRRRWLASDGALTEAGHEARVTLEDETDRLAMQPWAVVGDDELEAALRALRACLRSPDP